MLNKGSGLVLIMLGLVACGAGSEKAGFDDYEKQVGPALEEDAKLRDKFDERLKDLQILEKEAGFDDLLKNRMVPHYRGMLAKTSAIEPEDPKLVRIHSILIRYVELRLETFETFLKLERMKQLEGPTMDAVDAATQEVQKRAGALNTLLEKDSVLMNHLRDLVSREGAIGGQFFKNLAMLRQGMLRSKAFLEFADGTVDPFYDEAVKEVEGIDDLAEGVAEGIEAAKAYYLAQKGLVAATRRLAQAREASEEEMIRLQERFAAAGEEAEEALNTYKLEAKQYRDALR